MGAQGLRKLASQCLNLNGETGGKSGPYARLEVILEARQSGKREALTPLADDLARRVQPGRNHIMERPS